MRRMHSPTPYTRRVSAHAKACRLGRSAKALHMHAPTPTPLYTWPSLSHIAHTRAHTWGSPQIRAQHTTSDRAHCWVHARPSDSATPSRQTLAANTRVHGTHQPPSGRAPLTPPPVASPHRAGRKPPPGYPRPSRGGQSEHRGVVVPPSILRPTHAERRKRFGPNVEKQAKDST